ncbi:GmrSD restriction endonuclease domain-containing protein [Arenimonas sp. MALMAid1274]|uniref:GmrSD restriction endonuclease domain-containing protein n=1 Tax=Arenimonas sp. MALMAid1274 TaxID=3411630 RepID=UPI003BA20D8B
MLLIVSILPSATAKPEIVVVTDLMDGVLTGEYRIPRFQRPYVWSPDDMLQLFDSVLKGYPIGSLLVWQTERRDISSLDNVGPIQIESSGPIVKSYVVDGHQRLATLLGVLRLPESHPRSKLEDWRWWVAYDLRNEQFVHLREPKDKISLLHLPLRSVLRTVDFARRTREILNSQEFTPDEANTYLDRADTLQRAIRDYRVPMTVLKSGSLDDAVTIFARVNQRGRDMTPDQMISALTFRDEQDGNFDLAASIDEILGELRVFGLGDLHRRVILQSILALADLDFTRPSYERIVNRNSYEKMRQSVIDSKAALLCTAKFLRDDIGLPSSRLLPYSSIAVLLSIFFGQISRSSGEFSASQRLLLIKWFWATSFNGWFAGANTTDLRQAGKVMRSFADNAHSPDTFDNFFFGRDIRPFPESFDRRSARIRASLLVQLTEGSPKDPRTGTEISPEAINSDGSLGDIPYFFPNERKPRVSNPANRVILPTGYPRNSRAFFTQLDDSNLSQSILRSHFISEKAIQHLRNDEVDDFIDERERSLLNAEARFLHRLGLAFNVLGERSAEEIDSTD